MIGIRTSLFLTAFAFGVSNKHEERTFREPSVRPWHEANERPHHDKDTGPDAQAVSVQAHAVRFPEEAKGKKNLMTYSLYGKETKYTLGALENAHLIKALFPEWTMRVYYDDSVPSDIVSKLRAADVELVDMTNSTVRNRMSWRFLPWSETDDSVFRVCPRDSDSRLSLREKNALDAWSASDKSFHSMRDHPQHCSKSWPLLGGTTCAIAGRVSHLSSSLSEFEKKHQGFMSKGWDQTFLANIVWPIAKKSILVHDSNCCTLFGKGETKPFPTRRESDDHIGSVWEQDKGAISFHRATSNKAQDRCT